MIYARCTRIVFLSRDAPHNTRGCAFYLPRFLLRISLLLRWYATFLRRGYHYAPFSTTTPGRSFLVTALTVLPCPRCGLPRARFQHLFRTFTIHAPTHCRFATALTPTRYTTADTNVVGLLIQHPTPRTRLSNVGLTVVYPRMAFGIPDTYGFATPFISFLTHTIRCQHSATERISCRVFRFRALYLDTFTHCHCRPALKSCPPPTWNHTCSMDDYIHFPPSMPPYHTILQPPFWFSGHCACARRTLTLQPRRETTCAYTELRSYLHARRFFAAFAVAWRRSAAHVLDGCLV